MWTFQGLFLCLLWFGVSHSQTRGQISEYTCKEKIADVVFLLESSTTYRDPALHAQRAFLSYLVNYFHIGPHNIDVGIAIFAANGLVPKVPLGRSNTCHDLLSLLQKLRPTSGGTKKGKTARIGYIDEMFAPENGGRPWVEQVLVLIADGSFHAVSSEEAYRARNKGIEIFAVTVGDRQNSQLWGDLVSDPVDRHWFGVRNFSVLGTVGPVLTRQVCRTWKLCQEKAADVAILLDTSARTTQDDLKARRSFLVELIQGFNIGSNNIRVGIITICQTVTMEVALNAYPRKHDLLKKVYQIPLRRGFAHTDKAIRLVHKELFMTEKGGRPWAAKVIVLITDSGFKGDNTTQEAVTAKSKGVQLFTVGVGRYSNMEQLTNIASFPTARHVFRANGYTDLKNIRRNLTKAICQKPGNNTVPDDDDSHTIAIKRCKGVKAEIIFLLDSSHSIWAIDYKRQKKFVSGMLELFDVRANKTRVGVAIFSNTVEPVWCLVDSQNVQDIWRAVNSSAHLKVDTQTGMALQYARTRGLSTARQGVTRVVIVLTDGSSSEPDQTEREAKAATKEGIYVFAVGVGQFTDLQELMSIASDPDEDFLFHVMDYRGLQKIKELIALKVCGVKPPVTLK